MALWVMFTTMVATAGLIECLIPNLVVDVNSCDCTVLDVPCHVEEIKDAHHVFEKTDSYPSEPRNLEIMAFPSGENTLLKFSWNGGAGDLEKTTGFGLIYILGNEHQWLHLPVVNLSTLDSNIVRWTVVCSLNDGAFGKDVDVQVESLPWPPGNSKAAHASTSITIPLHDSMLPSNAYHWTPAVSIVPRQSQDTRSRSRWELILAFQFPRELSEKIEQFRITVKSSSDDSSINYSHRPHEGMVELVFPVPRDEENECFTFEIDKVCKGCYADWLCKDADECKSSNRIKKTGSLNDSCKERLFTITTTGTAPSEVTIETNITYTVTSIYEPPMVKVLDPEGTGRMSRQQMPEDAVLVYVLIPLTIIIALTILVLAFVYRRRCKMPGKSQGHDSCIDTCLLHPEEQEGDQPSDDSHSNNGSSKTAIPHEETLRRMRIMLLYSDDHKAHMEVICKFADFLQEQCSCDVIFDEWCLKEMVSDVFSWYLKEVESADKVIVIHSEGAYRKYKARLDKKVLYDKESSPRGDTFSKILPIVIDKVISGSDKFIMAFFDYTPVKYLIPVLTPAFKYKLPMGMEDFVLHIHDSCKFQFKMISEIPFTRYKDYHEKEMGEKLREALDEAHAFTANNANWFDDRFYITDRKEEFSNAESFDNEKACEDQSSIHSNISEAKKMNLQPPSENGSYEDLQSVNDDRDLYSPHGIEKEMMPEPHGLQTIGNDLPENYVLDSGIESLRDILPLQEGLPFNIDGFDPNNLDMDSRLPSEISDFHPPESISSGRSSISEDNVSLVECNIQFTGGNVPFGQICQDKYAFDRSSV